VSQVRLDSQMAWLVILELWGGGGVEYKIKEPIGEIDGGVVCVRPCVRASIE
jgi:hypothetical protein